MDTSCEIPNAMSRLLPFFQAIFGSKAFLQRVISGTTLSFTSLHSSTIIFLVEKLPPCRARVRRYSLLVKRDHTFPRRVQRAACQQEPHLRSAAPPPVAQSPLSQITPPPAAPRAMPTNAPAAPRAARPAHGCCPGLPCAPPAPQASATVLGYGPERLHPLAQEGGVATRMCQARR